MSFSCRIDRAGVEWSGTDLRGLFAQPRNGCRPAFWQMLRDIVRFNRATTAMHARGSVWSISLGEYLDDAGFSAPQASRLLGNGSGATETQQARRLRSQGRERPQLREDMTCFNENFHSKP
jgi:hypothetical protein